MARDVFIRLNRCQYCNRPGFVMWDADLFTCDREICKTLAFAELHRRSRSGLAPEVKLARALLRAFDTFEATVHRDVAGELFDDHFAARLVDRERRETARLISQVRAMARASSAEAGSGLLSSAPPSSIAALRDAGWIRGSANETAGRAPRPHRPPPS